MIGLKTLQIFELEGVDVVAQLLRSYKTFDFEHRRFKMMHLRFVQTIQQVLVFIKIFNQLVGRIHHIRLC